MHWKITNAVAVDQGIELTVELREEETDIAPLETQMYVTQKRTVEEIKAECDSNALARVLASVANKARQDARAADQQFAPTLINMSGAV